MNDQNDPDIRSLLETPLSAFEASRRSVDAFAKLGLTTVRQLLTTPARDFMKAASDYRSVSEMQAMLSDMALLERGWPFEDFIPPEEQVFADDPS